MGILFVFTNNQSVNVYRLYNEITQVGPFYIIVNQVYTSYVTKTSNYGSQETLYLTLHLNSVVRSFVCEMLRRTYRRPNRENIFVDMYTTFVRLRTRLRTPVWMEIGFSSVTWLVMIHSKRDGVVGVYVVCVCVVVVLSVVFVLGLLSFVKYQL